MKKIIIALMVVILTGCSNDVVMVDEQVDLEEIQVETQQNPTDYIGTLGDKEISMTYALRGDRVISAFTIDGEKHILTSDLVGEAVIATDHSNTYYFIENEGLIIGIEEASKSILHASNKGDKRKALSEQVMRLQGVYYSGTSDYFKGSRLEVYPIAEHLFFISYIIYDGGNTSQESLLLYGNDQAYRSYDESVFLTLTDQFEFILEGDIRGTFSEGFMPIDPSDSVLQLDPDSVIKTKFLLGDAYENLLTQAQVIISDGTSKSYGLKDEDPSYGIIIEDYIYIKYYGEEDILYTNNLGDVPVRITYDLKEPRIVAKAVTSQYNISDDGLPSDYILMDQVNYTGDEAYTLKYLSNGQEGLLILQGQEIVWITDQGMDVDDFENMTLSDNQIVLRFYDRELNQTRSYVYDLNSFRLLEVEISTYDKESNTSDKRIYDLIKHDVIINGAYFKKTKEEVHYLPLFNIRKDIDYDYN